MQKQVSGKEFMNRFQNVNKEIQGDPRKAKSIV